VLKEIGQGKRSISDPARIVMDNIRYYYFKIRYGIDLTERFVPHLKWGHNYCIHVHRYIFALGYIKKFDQKPSLIDLGCGVGYGDYFLSEYCAKITGIDISNKAIEYAKSHYQGKNIEYICADLTKNILELNTCKYDIVLSFEVVEHLRPSDRDAFFRNFHSLLSDNGIGIISTPHKKGNILEKGEFNNPYHLDEMDSNDFRSLLSKYFATIKIFAHYVRSDYEYLYSTKGKQPDEVYEIKELNEDILKKGDFGLIGVVTKK